MENDFVPCKIFRLAGDKYCEDICRELFSVRKNFLYVQKECSL